MTPTREEVLVVGHVNIPSALAERAKVDPHLQRVVESLKLGFPREDVYLRALLDFSLAIELARVDAARFMRTGPPPIIIVTSAEEAEKIRESLGKEER